jgi:hypothetical protein
MISVVLAIAVAAGSAASAVSAVRDSGPKTGSVLSRVGLTTVPYGWYPFRACDFIEHERFPSTMHMYNIYGDGGFLIWRIPDHPVYIDGRADIYFGKILDQIGRMRALPFNWRQELDPRIDMIVSSAGEPQSKLFLSAPDWALVYVALTSTRTTSTTIDSATRLSSSRESRSTCL